MSTERSRRRWMPALWAGYGAVYVLAFAVRGQTAPALVTAVLVAAVTVGLVFELRRPRAARPEQFGWTQDERQRLIHQKSMALVGYAALAAVTVTGFIASLVDADIALWPMLAIAGLAAVYGGGVTFYQRRG